jgi:hypothetical protein
MEPGTSAGSPARPIRQGRPGVIVLIAFVVELVVIGALANQVATKHLQQYVTDHPDAFPGKLVAALTTYQWRVSAQPGDRANEPIAHILLDVVVLVLTALLVLAIARGAVTFFRAFFGTWMAVIVATLVATVVFSAVSPPPYPTGYSHVEGAIFLGPSGYAFVAGVVLGFVTALLAAIFAVATRRTIRPATAYPADAGAEPYRDEYRDDYADTRREPDPAWNDQTAAYPREGYGGYYAGQAGGGEPGGYRSDEASAAPWSTPAGGPSSTPRSGAPSEHEGAAATQQLRTVPAGEPTQQSVGEPTQQSVGEPTEQSVGEPTQAMPSPAADADDPSVEAPATGSSAAPEAETDATRSFPRPPDDEDLEPHPEQHDL